LELLDDSSDEAYKKQLNDITPLDYLIKKHQPKVSEADSYFLKEFLLWGLVAHKKLSKHRYNSGYQFKDLYGGFISKL
jgi:magnesium chelatase subunit I